MTAKDSADGVLRDIAEAGATEAWNIANFFMDKCVLTHAGATMRGFLNLGDRVGLMYASNSGRVSKGRPAKAGVAPKQTLYIGVTLYTVGKLISR